MYNPPAYALTPTDQRGLVVITATMLMSWMVIVSLIRLYMRLALNGPLGWDDLAAFVGGLFGIANVGVIMNGVSHGLAQSARSATDSELVNGGKTLLAADLLFIAGHCGAKLSVCLLLKRLGREPAYLLWCKGALLLTTLWAIASMVSVGILSNSGRALIIEQMDSRVQNNAWKGITAIDVITETLLVGLSMYLVWGIRMKVKQKVAVIFAFGTRTTLIIISIVRQIYLNRAFSAPDLSLRLSDALVATEVLLHFSIMAATMPCLKPFVVAFNTGWGQGIKKKNAAGSYYYDSHNTTSHAQSKQPRDEDELNPTVTGASEGSDNSQQLIIRETREWTLRTEYIEMDSYRK
ncbi:hypothetical protein P170DRAFT_427822 [Aspergillus steynii IBT 23096]|uniref:Rhodopsin domain-containing protein n=1 Tax=Aspergillus steynii IBT 23096 TaxID=1392250 RepID=A0A2I2G0V1_9EURO|nr:uncharacterized protein P170DRAFT_427822 [Aspergillus steynii IBT 23096]PLB46507.1 hypothetical protein P170DRAFT_427822 [Aspergillus steynii IBT 23096]